VSSEITFSARGVGSSPGELLDGMIVPPLSRGVLGDPGSPSWVERFFRQMGRTMILTPATSCAGLEIEQLLPGKFFDFRYAVGLRFLEIGNLSECPSVIQRAEVYVQS